MANLAYKALVRPIELLHIKCVLLYLISQISVSSGFIRAKSGPLMRPQARILYLLILWWAPPWICQFSMGSTSPAILLRLIDSFPLRWKCKTNINQADFVSWWMWFNCSHTKVQHHFVTDALCYHRTYMAYTKIRWPRCMTEQFQAKRELGTWPNFDRYVSKLA